MTKSQVIRQKIVDFISDGNRHSVQEMKEYLQKCDIGEYSEGQFAGVINNLQKNGTIDKVERGVYIVTDKDNSNQKKCFVVSPIGDENSDIRKNADQLFFIAAYFRHTVSATLIPSMAALVIPPA